MATEIERKFLVKSDAWRCGPGTRYRQGYLNRDKHRTVRVRVMENRATLTVKGLTRGATRDEFEYDVPLSDGEEMLALCEKPLLEKYRHTVVYEGSRWEIDEFKGALEGLVLAEIELESEDQAFAGPPWLGDEVTDDSRYYNSNLSLGAEDVRR